MSEFKPAAVAPATIAIDGKDYMRDARGALVPLELVKPADKLEDELVRREMGFAIALSEQHLFTNLGEFDALLAQEYKLGKGGAKGNRSYTSYDGLMRVSVRVADLLDFGPGLQAAKALVDECLTEWSADSRPEIRAIVTRAFNTDREGQINRSEIFMLLRLDIAEPRWVEAMRALREAMRVVGSKLYVRIERRARADARWEAVTIDLAAA
jgi:hypothetical protein